MLSRQNNELLTRVGPGTPLGTFMRRYWHPIALSSQVADPDGPPLRTRLLGQRFVVFRDSEGRVGVLDEACMHRGVSLALGRNEEGGLRCLYHGWKFSVDGEVLDMPNADCALRRQMKAPAYPVREQSGLVWAYIGPPEFRPAFREFAFDAVPEANRTVFRANVKANWLPVIEGGLDSSHVAFLHTNLVRPGWRDRADQGAEPNPWENLRPQLEIENTAFGFHYCALRQVPGQKRNARLVPAILPNIRLIPYGPYTVWTVEVPMDDEETASYVLTYSADAPVDREREARMFGFESPLYDPVTCDFDFQWSGAFGQDRSSMDRSWSGYAGVELEDMAISASIGPDWDRTREHLVESDIAIVHLRRRLMEALRLFDQGEAPIGASFADMRPVSCFDRTLGEADKWQDCLPDYGAIYSLAAS
ncbi:MAG: Rieske 2Fe-2S domain-containing protein [Sphingomonadales bacterium]|nr:Rieske 2Fe-2S domain-containing protein [Sphingomonadales bacterium]